MKERVRNWTSFIGVMVLAFVLAMSFTMIVYADQYTYTFNADFEQGMLVNLNDTSPINQLQINQETEPLPFINVACSSRGTVVRIDTRTGEIVGEYLTAPDGMGRNPSRTTVDLYGNIWLGNRNEGDPNVNPLETKGSVVKIGIVIGGTRCNADRTPNPNGDYLAPPFQYNTCIDRDGDGLIKTSHGAGDIRTWLNNGGVDNNGGVSTADDEAILIYSRVNGTGVRHLSIDANNNVWVGGYFNRTFDLLNGNTGAILSSFSVGGGGYGGLIDSHGVLWSAGRDPYGLLRYEILKAPLIQRMTHIRSSKRQIVTD